MSVMMSTNRRRGAAFSLVELLVVISIISILASMLMPALRKARFTARSLSCISNLKQQGMGVSQYANAFSEWLPTLAYGSNLSACGWKLHLGPYLVPEGKLNTTEAWLSKGVFRCLDYTGDTYTAMGGYGGGYGWLYHLGNKDNDATAPRRKQTALKRISETIFIGDCNDMPVASLSSCSQLKPPGWGGDSASISIRHNVGANNLWGDLHVSWTPKSTLQAGKPYPAMATGDYYYLVKLK